MELDAALHTLTPFERPEPEAIAVEAPVALTVNGISRAVMMATPAQLDDFALGLALSEGWLNGPQELLDVELLHHAAGMELALQVTAACEQRLKARQRTLAGRTGCGLCGTESLAEMLPAPPKVTGEQAITQESLQAAAAALPREQVWNAQCGGLHAAAWCSAAGHIEIVREDVGRHNALDKLIGARAHQGAPSQDGFVLMSSRASYELVHKAATAGVGTLACMSAPSSLAIESAQRWGVHLWAFVREGRATRYA